MRNDSENKGSSKSRQTKGTEKVEDGVDGRQAGVSEKLADGVEGFRQGRVRR